LDHTHPPQEHTQNFPLGTAAFSYFFSSFYANIDNEKICSYFGIKQKEKKFFGSQDSHKDKKRKESEKLKQSQQGEEKSFERRSFVCKYFLKAFLYDNNF
jgi:hypothetical protein